jgi:geranylgeranyl diphosphate synthase type I
VPVSARHQRSPRTAADRLEQALAPYRAVVSRALRPAVTRVRTPAPADHATEERLASFYGRMEYHFGWRDVRLEPAAARPGKLLRPVLLLLAYDLARATHDGGRDNLERKTVDIMPAALAIELVHNFSLIHDDIEDGDVRRHDRATLWKVWGQPQAINTGDGVFALAHLTVLELVNGGVPAETVLRLAGLLDLTCLRLCEGQFLDMSFEGQRAITMAMYLAMIERKTAALMECATEFGARLAGLDGETTSRYAAFGNGLGIGFQLRDDILGIWASDAKLGKAAAGDLRRRKMTLPVIYALAHASATDYQELETFLSSTEEVTDEHTTAVLAILERAGARAAALAELRARSTESRRLLDSIAAGSGATAARDALVAVVDYIESDLPEAGA